MTSTKQEGRRYYPALRGVFGDWVYYSCLMSIRDVTRRLHFADEIHKSKNLSDMIQRAVKAGRSKDISAYLLREPERFFNSLVVAIHGGEPSWHGFANFRRVASDLDLRDVSEDAEDGVGFLSFSGEEQMFAVDGQHRLAGMKEAIKTSTDLADDQVSLLIVAHQETKAGKQKTRRLFTTLNKTAVPVGKGEIIALDENDVMAIATRYLVEEDKRFADPRIKFTQADNLPVTATELTTIGNLYDVLTSLFTRCIPKARLSSLRYIRPPDNELEGFIKLAQNFFSNLAHEFPPLNSYFSATSEDAARIVAKERTVRGGHVLFRPVGLRIFTEIAGDIVKKEGLKLQAALRMVSNLPVELSELPYADVIWLRNGRMSVGARVLCRRLLLYMLNREPKPAQLKERYAQHLGIDEARVRMPRRVV